MGFFDVHDDFSPSDYSNDLWTKIMDFTQCIIVASNKSKGCSLFTDTLFVVPSSWAVET